MSPAKKATKKSTSSTTKKAAKASSGFTADEKAAMKERARELKAKADGETDCSRRSPR